MTKLDTSKLLGFRIAADRTVIGAKNGMEKRAVIGAKNGMEKTVSGGGPAQ